jgi:ATP-dependent helicase/nuclease subunit A
MAATERQNLAITTHDRSMVVTAGAGTGKTYVLVRKYIDLLETRGVRVPEILALTYTEKAAAEMKERIRAGLSGRSGQFWERANEEFLVAPVQTFHSFCAQILREFPIEAGLEPGFAVLDEQQMARIHEESFESLITTPGDGTSHDALVRVLSIIEPGTLRGMLLAMYAKRREYREFFTALAKNENAIVLIWQEKVHAFRDAEIVGLLGNREFASLVAKISAFAVAYDGVDDKAAFYLTEIRPFLEHLVPSSGPAAFCESVDTLLTKKMGNVGSKKNWQGSDLEEFKAARKRLIAILEQKEWLCWLTVEPSDPLVTRSLRLLSDLSFVFARYLELVDEAKSGIGGLDFSDLILHARRLVTEDRQLVATHLAKRFRYILVDEFQDTDPAQFEIVLALVGNPGPGTDSLFIVGDPKQSIYLFRDADVTRFKEAQLIVDTTCQGKVVNLDTSFRSTGPVLELANFLFSRLFASAEKPWEFGYEPVNCSDARKEHTGFVELMLVTKEDTGPATKRAEATMVARRVQSLVAGSPAEVYEELSDRSFVKRPARYGDIVILLEQRTNLSYYLAALARYGVPYYVHGGTGFYGRQEIFDLYSIFSFLENRHDDVSLLGTLRSPYFGLKDTELFYIAHNYKGTLWEKLCQSADAKKSGPAARARDLLSAWQLYTRRIGLSSLFRKILGDSGIYAVYGALPEGVQMLANIEKLAGIVRSREEKESYAISDLIRDLRRSMEDEEREGEAPLDALAENAVNIMTVHAAKGLEFPIVIVPDMGTGFRERFGQIMIGDDTRLVGIRVPNPKDDYTLADSPVLAALREMQREKERAEKKRLLYVALTRARDHLIMSGTQPEDLLVPSAFAKTRIEWVTAALGITRDAITAGERRLDTGNGTSLKLMILSRPEQIPAEVSEKTAKRIDLPEDLKESHGTRPVPAPEPESRPKIITVSEFEKEKQGGKIPVRVVRESRYLSGVPGETKGTIIHEVLRGRDAKTVLEEFGEYSEEHVRQCEEIRAVFLASDLMKRAKRSFCELAFVVTYEGRLISGKIDRLCELDDGSWVVIDYKSEAVSPEEYALVAEEYRVSMAVYCEAARRLVAGKTVAGFLYFTETGEFWLE